MVTGQCVPLGAPTHTTYQRAVKTAALHAFHTGGHKEREKKLFKNGNTHKQAVLASRGPLAAVQAARDRFPASGGKMRRYQHATGPRRIDHGAAATATGHGPRGMEHGPCGCGRRSRSPGGRGRRRLGGRGTCLSGACHESCSKCRRRGHETQTRRTSRPACRARATPRDRGRGRTPRPKLQRGQARRRGVFPRGVHPAPRRPRLLLP